MHIKNLTRHDASLMANFCCFWKARSITISNINVTCEARDSFESLDTGADVCVAAVLQRAREEVCVTTDATAFRCDLGTDKSHGKPSQWPTTDDSPCDTAGIGGLPLTSSAGRGAIVGSRTRRSFVWDPLVFTMTSSGTSTLTGSSVNVGFGCSRTDDCLTALDEDVLTRSSAETGADLLLDSVQLILLLLRQQSTPASAMDKAFENWVKGCSQLLRLCTSAESVCWLTTPTQLPSASELSVAPLLCCLSTYCGALHAADTVVLVTSLCELSVQSSSCSCAVVTSMSRSLSISTETSRPSPACNFSASWSPPVFLLSGKLLSFLKSNKHIKHEYYHAVVVIACVYDPRAVSRCTAT